MSQVILFDLDNTLTDRPRSISAFAQCFLAHFGPAMEAMPLEELDAIMQEGDQLGYQPKSHMFVDLYARLPWLMVPSVDTISDFWYAESPACMQPREGMQALFDTLHKADYRLGIITNGDADVQNKTLDALNVRHYLDVVVISEEVGARKPESAIFRAAMKALDSDSGWYVGDHPINDVVGASRAGLTPIWLRSGGHLWPEDQALPLYQIDQLCEIPPLLKLT
ncbi:MAG: HAD family hydrolase [Anaerolineae bacterium]|nr:HAD family hydrolase [Anaerolineae bacterium]